MDSVLGFLSNIPWWLWIIIFLTLVAVRDVFFQKKHTISHNFHIVGHLRYWLEIIGPEMRQYFKTFRKELLEITHASDYEYPCQLQMNDVEMSVDDHNLSKEFNKTFGYDKLPVNFESAQHFKACNYLRGQIT